eukprot:4494839-Pyramimonas_sp.AAC.1
MFKSPIPPRCSSPTHSAPTNLSRSCLRAPFHPMGAQVVALPFVWPRSFFFRAGISGSRARQLATR